MTDYFRKKKLSIFTVVIRLSLKAPGKEHIIKKNWISLVVPVALCHRFTAGQSALDRRGSSTRSLPPRPARSPAPPPSPSPRRGDRIRTSVTQQWRAARRDGRATLAALRRARRPPGTDTSQWRTWRHGSLGDVI